METEPLDGAVEPTEGEVETPEVEPTTPDEEPAKPEGEADEETEVDFMDLKSVPPEFQKVAKKLQAQYTKKMQTAREEALERMKFSGFEEKGEEVDPALEDRKAKVKEFISTEEGAAFKDVMMDLVKEYVGDTPQKVKEMEIQRETQEVIAKYGEDNITKNIDTIEEVSKKYPNAPLELVVRSVLYDSAKKLGSDEFKSKIVKKGNMSDPVKSAPSGIESAKKITTFEDAFNEALKI